jgi:hypothetical protein
MYNPLQALSACSNARIVSPAAICGSSANTKLVHSRILKKGLLKIIQHTHANLKKELFFERLPRQGVGVRAIGASPRWEPQRILARSVHGNLCICH